MIAVAQPVFMSLPKEYQTIFMAAAQEAALYQREVCDKMEHEYIETLKKNGMEVTTPDIEPLREASKKVYEDFRGELGDVAELLDNIISAKP